MACLHSVPGYADHCGVVNICGATIHPIVWYPIKNYAYYAISRVRVKEKKNKKLFIFRSFYCREVFKIITLCDFSCKYLLKVLESAIQLVKIKFF